MVLDRRLCYRLHVLILGRISLRPRCAIEYWLAGVVVAIATAFGLLFGGGRLPIALNVLFALVTVGSAPDPVVYLGTCVYGNHGAGMSRGPSCSRKKTTIANQRLQRSREMTRVCSRE